jgi:hypothetical protein
MLVRADDLVIGQPAHAWVSGQLARAWGGPEFGSPAPREAVCLAAEQHDIGWHDRDLAPTLGPDARPLHFTQLPRAEHLALWTEAPRRLLAQSRYAALLVSLHGTSLYARVDPASHPAIGPYLEGQRALQRALAAGLDAAAVERNRLLLRTWDRFSLALCLPDLSIVLDEVPRASGAATLTLADADADVVMVAPWPFAADRVEVTCEARRLPGRFGSLAELHAALASAPWVPLRWTLVPG